jgi:hypothetical protein
MYEKAPEVVAIQTKMNIYNGAGVPICTARSTHAVFAFGGFDGERLPSKTLNYPERVPDYVSIDHISDIQAILYRLLGDTYDVHINTELAKSYGYEGPFLQGLCTYGFACRMGIQAVIPGEPERLTRIYAQMRSICYPGQDVKFVGWNMEGKVYFRLLNAEGKRSLITGSLNLNDGGVNHGNKNSEAGKAVRSHRCGDQSCFGRTILLEYARQGDDSGIRLDGHTGIPAVFCFNGCRGNLGGSCGKNR